MAHQHMLSRTRFLGYSAAGFLMPALSRSALGAAATPAPKDWDLCEHNWALPLDRPLGLVMHGLDGPDIDIVKLRGYGIVLNLFATWCPPCIEEASALEQAHKQYSERGIRLLGLDYKESDGTVRAFKKRYGITYPIAMDRDGAITTALLEGRSAGHTLFPTTLFISPDGYLYCQRVDAMSTAELSYRIKRFLDVLPPEKR